MAGPILYSTNPFMSFEISCKYNANRHFIWCSEVFDPTTQASISGTAMIGATSSPCALAQTLAREVANEERHSLHIKRYQKKFRLLATEWVATGRITAAQAQDIRDLVGQRSWRIWRPFVYIVPRAPLEAMGRLIEVPVKARAGHGPEFQVADLHTSEFDVMEWNRV